METQAWPHDAQPQWDETTRALSFSDVASDKASPPKVPINIDPPKVQPMQQPTEPLVAVKPLEEATSPSDVGGTAKPEQDTLSRSMQLAAAPKKKLGQKPQQKKASRKKSHLRKKNQKTNEGGMPSAELPKKPEIMEDRKASLAPEEQSGKGGGTRKEDDEGEGVRKDEDETSQHGGQEEGGEEEDAEEDEEMEEEEPVKKKPAGRRQASSKSGASAKGKAKAKAKAKTKAKAKAQAKSKQAGGGKRKAANADDPKAKNARKSKAYHRAKKEALEAGMTAEEAAEVAKEVS